MIILRLYGGIGNQLFQYAFGRYLSVLHNAELVFDLNWYVRTPMSDTKRLFELDFFSICGRKASYIESSLIRIFNNKYISNKSILPNKSSYHKESSYSFDKKALALPDNVYIDGYWQSYKYFESINNIISREIQLKSDIMCDNSFIKSILSSDSVSIHVRRGDYVSNHVASQYHGICSIEYYLAAISYVRQVVTNPVFYVFSDDIDWCVENFCNIENIYYVSSMLRSCACSELILMSKCKSHIIANSSFSWWGAWLGGLGKLTVAPKQWFSNGISVDDLLPPWWKVI